MLFHKNPLAVGHTTCNTFVPWTYSVYLFVCQPRWLKGCINSANSSFLLSGDYDWIDVSAWFPLPNVRLCSEWLPAKPRLCRLNVECWHSSPAYGRVLAVGGEDTSQDSFESRERSGGHVHKADKRFRRGKPRRTRLGVGKMVWCVRLLNFLSSKTLGSHKGPHKSVRFGCFPKKVAYLKDE